MTSTLEDLASPWLDYVEAGNWQQLPVGSLADLRHVHLHLSKLVGKLATPIELGDDSGELGDLSTVRDEVIPDLLLWAIHLANSLDVDLESAYRRRVPQS